MTPTRGLVWSALIAIALVAAALCMRPQPARVPVLPAPTVRATPAAIQIPTPTGPDIFTVPQKPI